MEKIRRQPTRYCTQQPFKIRIAATQIFLCSRLWAARCWHRTIYVIEPRYHNRPRKIICSRRRKCGRLNSQWWPIETIWCMPSTLIFELISISLWRVWRDSWTSPIAIRIGIVAGAASMNFLWISGIIHRIAQWWVDAPDVVLQGLDECDDSSSLPLLSLFICFSYSSHQLPRSRWKTLLARMKLWPQAVKFVPNPGALSSTFTKRIIQSTESERLNDIIYQPTPQRSWNRG